MRQVEDKRAMLIFVLISFENVCYGSARCRCVLSANVNNRCAVLSVRGASVMTCHDIVRLEYSKL